VNQLDFLDNTANQKLTEMFRPSSRVDGAHSEGVWTICWQDDSIVTGGLEGSCKLWKTEKSDDKAMTISLAATTKSAHSFGMTSVVISSDNEFAVSCTQDSKIQFFKMDDMSEIGVIDAGVLEAWSVSLSPGDEMVATGTHTGAVNLWSVNDKSKACTIPTNGKLIMSTAFGQEGTRLASVGMDGVLNIIDVISQAVIHRVEAHCMPSRKVIFSVDGNMLFTASDDRHVSAFDVRSGLAINSFSHSGMALSLDISPDRRHFVVGCSDHVVAYWDLGMQRCVNKYDSPHTQEVWGVAFDESGKKFVSCGEDGIVQAFESS
jgi:WD repeat-containing protein 61